MSTATTLVHDTGEPRPVLRAIGLPGRVAVTWSMAGGLLLGGVMVAWMTLRGQLSGHGLFMTATGLFMIGALLGAVHGAVLGYLGRPDSIGRRDTVHALGRSTLYAVLQQPSRGSSPSGSR